MLVEYAAALRRMRISGTVLRSKKRIACVLMLQSAYRRRGRRTSVLALPQACPVSFWKIAFFLELFVFHGKFGGLAVLVGSMGAFAGKRILPVLFVFGRPPPRCAAGTSRSSEISLIGVLLLRTSLAAASLNCLSYLPWRDMDTLPLHSHDYKCLASHSKIAFLRGPGFCPHVGSPNQALFHLGRCILDRISSYRRKVLRGLEAENYSFDSTLPPPMC